MKPLRLLVHFVRALLSELSDQRAYRLHLTMNGLPPSPEEWRRFSDARFARKFRQSRCC